MVLPGVVALVLLVEELKAEPRLYTQCPAPSNHLALGWIALKISKFRVAYQTNYISSALHGGASDA